MADIEIFQTNGTKAKKSISGNITLSAAGVVAVTSGAATTAATLTPGRTINGVAFDGSANIVIPTLGYVLYGGNALFAPADAITYYFGSLSGGTMRTVEGQCKMFVPKAGTIKVVYITWLAQGTAGSNENIPLVLRLNAATDTAIATVGDTNAVKLFSNTGLSIAVVAGDSFEIKMVSPTWVTNPTNVATGIYVYIE